MHFPLPDVECLVLEDPVDEGSEEVPEAVLALAVPVERHDHLHHHRVTSHHVRQPVNLGEKSRTVVIGSWQLIQRIIVTVWHCDVFGLQTSGETY